jgi:guanylate kinase
VDVQGVESFRRAARENPLLGRRMTTVFIVVDHDRLVARMRLRAQDDEAEIAGRMKTAERELREAHKFDFIIESRTRDEDFAALQAIVAKSRERAAQSSSTT